MTDPAAATPPSQAEAVPATRPRGRPRRPDVDWAILEATLDAFIQDGYEGMSVDGVAERAGVAKATVYRRWPSKQELLIAAGQHLYEEHVHFPDSGELRTDLVTLLRVVRHMATQTKAGQAMPRMVREVAAGTSLGRAFQERVLLPRFRLAKQILARAQERGELREWCRGKIASFKIPRYWKFVDEFPMTVTGKVQKFKMREASVAELGLEEAAGTRTA